MPALKEKFELLQQELGHVLKDHTLANSRTTFLLIRDMFGILVEERNPKPAEAESADGKPERVRKR